MTKLKLRFAALSDEAKVYAASHAGPRGHCRLYREHNPQAALRVRNAILESLKNLVLFPRLGRQQQVEGVRKMVTRRYPYLVYYTIEDSTDEVIILAIQHLAQEREHSDA